MRPAPRLSPRPLDVYKRQVMMHFAALEAVKCGVPEEKIWVSFERKMSCAVGKCGHCRIDETYVCLEGPVFPYTVAKNLLD